MSAIADKHRKPNQPREPEGETPNRPLTPPPGEKDPPINDPPEKGRLPKELEKKAKDSDPETRAVAKAVRSLSGDN
jgi:predicted Zn-dependent protease